MPLLKHSIVELGLKRGNTTLTTVTIPTSKAFHCRTRIETEPNTSTVIGANDF